MLKDFIDWIKQNFFFVKQKTNSYRWTVNTFSTSFARQFPGNTILFINNGLLSATINDVFPLPVGASLSLEGGKNEVDSTIYKLSFAAGAGASVSIFTKEDAGIDIVTEYSNQSLEDLVIPDRRKVDKERAELFKQYGRKGDDF